jgi:aspartate-semialdehyde dehydrogenase
MAGAKLIANPNCTTAIAAVVLHPIIQEFGIRKLIMSTYQAASGAGAEVSEVTHCVCIPSLPVYHCGNTTYRV